MRFRESNTVGTHRPLFGDDCLSVRDSTSGGVAVSITLVPEPATLYLRDISVPESCTTEERRDLSILRAHVHGQAELSRLAVPDILGLSTQQFN